MEHENAPVQASVAAVQAWGRIMAREHAVKCPNCKALYQLVRVEAGPETIDREITCQVCGSPLVGREGKFVLKYFLLREAVRRRRKGRAKAV
jgi:ssDNA-binding Zn-finger/Zn-ribbon topoisomerase 1